MKAAKKVANHVSRLSEVLDCALWLLFFGNVGRFFGSLRSDVVQMYLLLQAVGLVRFFSDTRSLGPKKAAVLLDETITTRVRQFDEARSSQATSCRPGSTGCCRLAKATEQEND